MSYCNNYWNRPGRFVYAWDDEVLAEKFVIVSTSVCMGVLGGVPDGLTCSGA